MLLGLVTAVVAIWNALGGRWPIDWWAKYWFVIGIVLPFLVGTVTFVWFTVGGVKDLRDFFAALRTLQRDASDNGQVREAPGGTGSERPVTEHVH